MYVTGDLLGSRRCYIRYLYRFSRPPSREAESCVLVSRGPLHYDAELWKDTGVTLAHRTAN